MSARSYIELAETRDLPGDLVLLARESELTPHAERALRRLDARRALNILETGRIAAGSDGGDGPQIVFSGHMIDRADAAAPRFPESDVEVVAGLLGDVLDRVGEGAEAHVSGACGGDIIFAEGCRARGIPVHLYLPFSEEQFLGTSVAFAGEDWSRRFRELCGAVTPKVMPEHLGDLGADSPYDTVNEWMLMSGACAGPGTTVVLWDGKGGKTGGTGSFVTRAEALGFEIVHVLPPAAQG